MSTSLKKLLQISKEFALAEAEKYQVPSIFHVELSHRVGQRLASELMADATVVAIGTYLMDGMLGVAYSEGRMQDHVVMSVEKAIELIAQVGGLDSSLEKNIVACIREHHGTASFSTLESEICCNADCYRFASIEGFVGGIQHSRKMELKALFALYEAKAKEKWQALSLPSCKTELKPQYEAIKQLIANYGRAA